MNKSIGGKEAAKFGPKEFGKMDAGQSWSRSKGTKRGHFWKM